MRLLTIIICISLLFSCTKKEKRKTLHGRLKNSEKSWIYLQKITDKGEETIDSVMSASDGSFEIKNPATSPEFYILRTDPTNLIFLVLNEGENVEVTGDGKDLEKTYKINGSKDSELIQQLRSHDRLFSDSLNKLFDSLRVNNPEKKDSIGFALQQVYTSGMEKYASDFIKKNLSSLVSLSATKFVNQQAELELMNVLADSLQKAYPENKYVKDYLTLMAELNKLPAGSVSPEISLNTIDGKPLSLSSFRGKIVLVDFWASWCAPCRRENPQLVEIYKKYKNQNFEIFGVSLDENIAAWKNAVEKDGITWPQVSDLKRWESSVVKEFQIEAIPYNILLDASGNIIAKGIRSEELDIKIMEAISKNSKNP
jgi:thiol-disulfide isomerase/thioredoxin